MHQDGPEHQQKIIIKGAGYAMWRCCKLSMQTDALKIGSNLHAPHAQPAQCICDLHNAYVARLLNTICSRHSQQAKSACAKIARKEWQVSGCLQGTASLNRDRYAVKFSKGGLTS